MASFKERWLVWIRAVETEPCTWSWLIAHISLYRNKTRALERKAVSRGWCLELLFDPNLTTAQGKQPEARTDQEFSLQRNNRQNTCELSGSAKSRARGSLVRISSSFFLSQLAPAPTPLNCLTKHRTHDSRRKRTSEREQKPRKQTKNQWDAELYIFIICSDSVNRQDPSLLSHGHQRAFQYILCSDYLPVPCLNLFWNKKG